MSDLEDFEKDLKKLLSDNEPDFSECIHVTQLLNYSDPPSDEQLTRGKLYHLAIETLLLKLFGSDIQLEQQHKLKKKKYW